MKNQKYKLTVKSFLSSFLLLATCYLLLAATANAVTTSPTPKTTPQTTVTEKEEKLIEQINDLKEKVASKVAELRLVEKRGIFIVVTDVSGNKITGEDLDGNNRIIDADELTKFSSPSAKTTFGISDITSGTTISAIGLYNKQSKRLLARFVEVNTLPVFLTGVISEVDKVNFTITVLSENKTETTVDIENITRTSIYTKEDGLVRSGFSRVEVGNRVFVTGFPNKGQKDRIIASRVILFPEAAKNPKISVAQPTGTQLSPSVRPTTRVTRTPTQ